MSDDQAKMHNHANEWRNAAERLQKRIAELESDQREFAKYEHRVAELEAEVERLKEDCKMQVELIEAVEFFDGPDAERKRCGQQLAAIGEEFVEGMAEVEDEIGNAFAEVREASRRANTKPVTQKPSLQAVFDAVVRYRANGGSEGLNDVLESATWPMIVSKVGFVAVAGRHNLKPDVIDAVEWVT